MVYTVLWTTVVYNDTWYIRCYERLWYKTASGIYDVMNDWYKPARGIYDVMNDWYKPAQGIYGVMNDCGTKRHVVYTLLWTAVVQNGTWYIRCYERLWYKTTQGDFDIFSDLVSFIGRSIYLSVQEKGSENRLHNINICILPLTLTI